VEDPNRLVPNRALRRRSGFFGFNTGLAILSLMVLLLGYFIAQVLPFGIAIAMTVSMFVATLYIFRDGTDPVVGRFRKPRHYTRAGLDYIQVFHHDD
jgi:regulator of protease activity HflC (stomatin/prohibitin superfamily)